MFKIEKLHKVNYKSKKIIYFTQLFSLIFGNKVLNIKTIDNIYNKHGQCFNFHSIAAT